uniref:NADH:ubiquinone oxidoreductase intermediate-associated protein 30 domain-containing protein n=1 Tax=Chromera velia CCMP2878 TaxID=1169474 RepID=A0A0G4HZ09_9ALVE|mmetsp:Transcript_48008/g.94801  ORF Transcript_48008/g.94801 Transcript_48008/m.94801 type:complete len:212 (+) Transcript_48008:292-927(+)|eukprot:Cvel_1550.t1-p1 / transcript=Cvel_1550.t1 / gene=Cvel_1550 / organism=Chromera_velia_CCMP2878 / gene_product=hypothetical protein / transcript_product=hypothetical protein / location=Cvel_scaffold55:38981-39613(-) / protein_length=211 / sequence_SO=supercontig / SO=protein_coding / is_pseudo=false
MSQLTSICFLLLASLCKADVIFDFHTGSTTQGWIEVSDTTRKVGMSKGLFGITESEAVRHATFLAVLNPQPNGACFAGTEFSFPSPVSWLSDNYLRVRVRIQGDEGLLYKIILTDTDRERGETRSFQYTLPQGDGKTFANVVMALSEFKCTFRGKPCEGTLNTDAISSIGIQVAGGRYEERQGSGPVSVEIEHIDLLTDPRKAAERELLLA